MKSNWQLLLSSIFCMLFLSVQVQAQNDMESDSTGLPGDNFSLEAALDLFKKSSSLEEFEKLLNSEDNVVNNLDLNEDGEIDYIRVIDNMEGDVHAIVLQVPVSETESQDIAVIEVEKTGNETAMLQIIGDEDIYGSAQIVEPFEDEVQKGGKGGPAVLKAPVRVIVNVWLWPSVRFVYAPGYRVYVSPYRWRVYPSYWRPWRPHPWGWYHARVRPYRVHYHVVTTHRVVHAHKVYAPRRTHSTVVHTRTTTTVTRRNTQHKASATRTTTTTKATGPRGGQATKQTKSTTVQGPRGNSVTKQKSTTTKTGPRGNSATQQKSSTTVKKKGNGRH